MSVFRNVLLYTQVQLYYNGFSNRSLWPLFHSLPMRTHYSKAFFDSYREVNRAFADAALKAVSGTLKSLVWYFEDGGMVLRRGCCGTLMYMTLFTTKTCYVIFFCFLQLTIPTLII